MPSQSSSSPVSVDRLWLVSPAMDVVVGAGGWSLPVLLLAGYAASVASSAAAFAFYALALVVNYPHFAATVVRAYRGGPKHRLVTVGLTALLGAVLIGAHLATEWLPLLFAVYLTWSPWHYTSQNRGIATLFLRRAGLNLEQNESRLLRVAFFSSFLMWALGMHSGPSTESFARLDLNPAWTLPARFICLAVFVGGIGFVFSALQKRVNANAEGKRPAMQRALTLAALVVSTQLLWFVLPWVLEVAGLMQLTPLYYAAGALAVMHGAQYLWVIFFTEKKEHALSHKPFSTGRHYALLVGVGAALFLLGPWTLSRGFSVDIVMSFLLFQAVVNIHHFAVDGVIWRLREPAVARVFSIDDDNAPSAAAPATLSPLKIAGIFVLVAATAIGVVDVAQFALTRAGADNEALDWATRLNPNDPRIALRRAEAAMRENNVDAALVELNAGLKLAPAHPPLLRAKADVLALSKDFEAAYVLEQEFPERMRNVDTLLHLGVLARALKKPEAAASWIALAAAKAPDHPEVLRHQGIGAAESDDKRAAIGLYERALVQTAKKIHGVNSDDVVPSDALIGNAPDSVTLDVACDLAHLYVQEKKFDDAEALLRVITPTSVRVRSAVHAMRSVGDAGRVHLGRGQTTKGIVSLQRALKIATEVDAPLEEAEIWGTLASALEANDAPLALRFACMLKANALGSSVKVTDGLRAYRLRKAILGNLGRMRDAMDDTVANRVLTNLDGFSAEALAYRPAP